jgi:hypothetical protein
LLRFQAEHRPDEHEAEYNEGRNDKRRNREKDDYFVPRIRRDGQAKRAERENRGKQNCDQQSAKPEPYARRPGSLGHTRSRANEITIIDAAINVSDWLSKQKPTKPEDSGLPLASQGTWPN